MKFEDWYISRGYYNSPFYWEKDSFVYDEIKAIWETNQKEIESQLQETQARLDNVEGLLHDMCRLGQQIMAIKLHRAINDSSLREAKDYYKDTRQEQTLAIKALRIEEGE